MVDDIDRRIAESLTLGSVRSSTWQSYTWKNELSEQKRRIGLHLEEVFADADAETEYNPYHMLERAIGVASVCMRRLIECRLITDRFRGSRLDVREIHTKANTEWREPFVSRMVSEIFNNYDLKARHAEQRSPKYISDKMLHARVIGVLSASAYLPDGLLIASDYQSKSSLFHFTPVEIAALFDAFLKDEVSIATDGYLDADGNYGGAQKSFATRA